MTISQEDFYGGAQATSVSVVLKRHSPRVTSCYNASAINVDLPNPTGDLVSQHGREAYTVLAHGAGTVTVRNHLGVTIKSVTSGKAGRFYLAGTNWIGRLSNLSTSKAIHRGSRASITVQAGVPAKPLSCFTGDDCDLADASGNGPLDGEDGRDKAIVPFCEDVTLFAKNANREPIRACDLVMPKIVVVGFRGTTATNFEPDPLHPEAATVLPTEFYEALRNNEAGHALVYDAALSGPNKVTRHWHHLRWTGTTPTIDWAHGTGAADYEVTRHIWKKVITYTDLNGDGADHTIEIRFVAEHTLSAEPGVDPVADPGSAQDLTYGAWGTLFMVYVFCDQLASSFVDDDTYAPVDAPGPIQFSKADPCASGLGFNVGGTEDQKFCHPQLVLAACTPTTFQAPMGRAWVPTVDRKYYKAFEGDYTNRGGNREICYNLSNGAPWTDPGCPAAPAGVGILRNIVFGWDLINTNGAAMSLGGSFEGSKPYEFLTWENGLGVGRTYLKPLKPGWDEACGTLDTEGGSSGSIKLCIDDKWGIDDGTGRKKWPKSILVACEGHPDEPFEGIGGSHVCYNPGEDVSDATCCYSTQEPAYAEATDYCTKDVTSFGEFTGAECTNNGTTCNEFGRFLRGIIMELEDYDYVMNGNQDLRAISWYRYLPDTDWVPAHFVHPGPGTLTQLIGTWSTASSMATVTIADNTNPVKSAIMYDSSTVYTFRDCKAKGQAKKATMASHGLFVRGVSGFTGFIGIVVPTGGTNATVAIRKYVANVATTLVSTSISNLTSDIVDMEMEAWGTDITFRWKVNGSADWSEITVATCDLPDGKAGWCSETNSTNVQFGNMSVDDQNYQYIEATATGGKFELGITFPWEMHELYTFPCDGLIANGDCGDCCDPPKCNCTRTVGEAKYLETALHSHTPKRDIIMPACPTNGDNPTMYDGGLYKCDCLDSWCAPTNSWRCGECPMPYECLRFHPPSCRPTTWPVETIPNICGGITYWCHPTLSCS